MECIHGVAPAYLQELCLVLTGGNGPRSPSATVGINWLFPSAKSTDVNRSEKFAFCGPRVWSNNLSLNSEHVRVAISLHYLFAVVPFLQFWRRLKVWWSDVVVSALASINGVNLRRARLVLRWATVSRFNSRCRSAGHLFRYVTNQPPKANSAFHPSRVGRWVPVKGRYGSFR